MYSLSVTRWEWICHIQKHGAIQRSYSQRSTHIGADNSTHDRSIINQDYTQASLDMVETEHPSTSISIHHLAYYRLQR